MRVSQIERENSKNYLDSIKNFDRPLTLLHIPKTAGTAMEVAASASKLHWGSCLFNHKPKRGSCNYQGNQLWPMRIGWWHLPLHAFPLAQTDPYQDAQAFAVTRTVWDRLVSEFYYICTLTDKDWRPNTCDQGRLYDKEYMNEWISRKLNQSESDYLLDNGHFTPQWEFLVAPHQVRRVDYVLQLDKVSQQFPRLVDAFGLGEVKLRRVSSLGQDKETNQQELLTPADLSDKTKRLITEKYKLDLGKLD